MKWRKLYKNRRNQRPFKFLPVMSSLTLLECVTSVLRTGEVGCIHTFTFLADARPSAQMAMMGMDKRQFRTWRKNR